MADLVVYPTSETVADMDDREYYTQVDATPLIKGADCWLINYRKVPPGEPGVEPVVIGHHTRDGETLVRVLWRDRVWRPATKTELDGMKRLAKLL